MTDRATEPVDDSVRVREALTGDVDAIVDVHTRARSAYYAAGGVADETLSDPAALARRQTAWAAVIASPDMTVLCAEAPGGSVVGVLAMGPPKDEDIDGSACRQLFQIHVHPDGWGRGTGGALHRAFTDRVTAGGFGCGVLEVWEANARAVGFYARRGWQRDTMRRPGRDGLDYVRTRLHP